MSGCSPTMDTLRRKAQHGSGAGAPRARLVVRRAEKGVGSDISQPARADRRRAASSEWGEVRVHQLPPLEIDGPGRRGRTGRDIADGLPPQNMPLAVRRHDRMPSHV